ncbi:MYXO-CTERM sorting domain-containing protein [Nannocystis sp. SCPEA4]|uniref:MYXO-CTERM sorting domain-containing protein n=1 Tax=Nannocystis sp. SCPEA4 TaxID=2996787 RepID=UPI0022710049|nr:MYXO-CTERM sorting domain-containing protein [Nannocystis sp. SCPEA4]MCY1057638.1 MYXO-CTERM sorting domain-containing protein [Nannocystis sp. SCPEA4]
MPRTNRIFRVLEGAALVGTCALVVSVPRLAEACGASAPELIEQLPIGGGSYPGNAALLFWGVELSTEQLTVTIDGEPATLVAAEFAAGLADLAVRVEPAPQEGQAVAISGKICNWEADCELSLTYTASAADVAAPAPIAEASFFAVYDHADLDLSSDCGEWHVERSMYVHLQQAAPASGEAATLFLVNWDASEGAGGIHRTELASGESTIISVDLDGSALGGADVMSEVCLEVTAIDAAGNKAEPFELCPPCFFRADEQPLETLPPEPVWTEADAVPGSACAPATETTGEDTSGGEETAGDESGEAPTSGGEPTTGGEPNGSETGEDTDSATGGEDDPGKGCACSSDGDGRGSLGHLLLLALGIGAARRRR